ncbi:MAG: hypothetical protein AAGH79_14870 [Bacteroidota bacterium]
MKKQNLPLLGRLLLLAAACVDTEPDLAPESFEEVFLSQLLNGLQARFAQIGIGVYSGWYFRHEWSFLKPHRSDLSSSIQDQNYLLLFPAK